MVRSLLDEARRAPLDDAGRRLLAEIHHRSVSELEGVLSPELRAELSEVSQPFESDTPTDSELRIAQAQLVGWLEGLFHGIQATLYTQQMAAQRQFEEMRQGGRMLPGAPSRPRAAHTSDHRPGASMTTTPTDFDTDPLVACRAGAALAAAQQPVWPDAAALDAALDELRASPPLVYAGKTRRSPNRSPPSRAAKAFCCTPATARRASPSSRPTRSAIRSR